MVGASSSSSSSCASYSSFDDVTVKTSTAKFLCSYGGKILPRYPDGKLRYVGGETRVLAVDRSVPFSELVMKLGELCGWGSVSLRCLLPTMDLDALVSVTSDEDLANLIEEYDLASRDKVLPLKIRAFLFFPSKTTPPPVTTSTKGKSAVRFAIPAVANHCVHQISAPARFPGRIEKPTGCDTRFHGQQNACLAHGNQRQQQYLVHHGNHWQ